MSNNINFKRLSVGFLVVEPAHPGSNPRVDMGARIFLDLFKDLTALFF